MSKGKKAAAKPKSKTKTDASRTTAARGKSARSGASARAKPATSGPASKPYTHPTHDVATRPEIRTQAQFRKKKPPTTYRYDSALSPALDWDGQNSAREQGEALIQRILDAKSLDDARGAAEELARLSKPFLNWAGKAERLSFDVPTLPLFVHERLSTKAILETLRAHKKDTQETLDLFGDPQRSITDQVMNSLLEHEGLGQQVQMI